MQQDVLTTWIFQGQLMSDPRKHIQWILVANLIEKQFLVIRHVFTLETKANWINFRLKRYSMEKLIQSAFRLPAAAFRENTIFPRNFHDK